MSWNEVVPAGSGNGGNGTKMDYIKLGPTAVQIRGISPEPFTRFTHWLPRANNGQGSSVRCIGEGCPACAMNKQAKAAKGAVPFPASKKHSMLVIDRADGKVKILEGGNTLFQQLKSVRDEGIDFYSMDVKIKKDGSGTAAAFTILPVMAATAPTEQGLENADFDLTTLNKPLTVDQMRSLMNGGSWSEIFPKDAAPTT